MICNATNNETVNTEKQCSDVNRLSELQKQVLVSLWKELRSIERDFEEFGGGGCRPLIGWRWQVVFNTPPTRSQCAALSRALRRLEQRGLVDRTNINTGSTHTGPLGVTNLGRVVASTLAGETDPYPTLRDWVKVSPGSLTPEELEARINDPHKRFG
jgi:hypothetical protein